MNPTPFRRAARASVVALGLGLGLVATPALAAPPETWENTDSGSVLFNVLVFVGVPIGAVLLITLMVYLPAMMRGESSQPSFQESAEWFGGPRAGVEAATGGPDSHAPTLGRPAGQPGSESATEAAKGGAGGQW